MENSTQALTSQDLPKTGRFKIQMHSNDRFHAARIIRDGSWWHAEIDQWSIKGWQRDPNSDPDLMMIWQRGIPVTDAEYFDILDEDADQLSMEL